MKNHKGITTIELLAILIIISIIALIAVPTVNTLIRNTENRAIEASLINMEEAVRLYRLDRGEQNPESFRDVMGFGPNESTTNENWELYGDRLLGDFISGGWPTPPFGGVFSYRFYTLDDNFPNPSLRQLTRSPEGELIADKRLINVFNIPGGRGATTGEFLQIRFGDFQTSNGGGVFNLDDPNTRDNTEAFIRTVEFLLDTSFGDRLFVWHRDSNENNNSLSGTADNNRAQLVILIYLDHDRWERRP